MKRKILSTVIIITTLIVAGFLFLRSDVKNEKISTQESPSASVEAPLEGEIENSFDIENDNQSLRLELFAKMMKEDPLLFDPYIDQKAYEDAVSYYNSSTADFIKLIKSEKISPTDFIEKFGKTSAEYRNFQKNVSLDNGKKLLSSIKQAQGAYINDVDAIIKSFEDIRETPDGKKNIVFVGGESMTNTAIILKDLKLIRKNGNEIAKEVEQREKCLTESVKFCKKPSEKFFKPGLPKTKNEVPNILSREILEIPSYAKLNGPYQVNSSCWNKRNYQWLYVPDNCKPTENCFSQPYLADNKFFTSSANWIKGSELMGLMVEMMPIGVTTPYTCNDLSYRVKAGSIDYFLQTYGKSRIFEELEKNSKIPLKDDFWQIITEGRKAEKAFFEAKYLSQDLLEYLGKFYLYAYAQSLDNDFLTDENRNQLLRAGILAQEKMTYLPKTINNLAMFTKRLEDKFVKMNAVGPLLYIYVTKSAYSLLFYPFSPSAWRLEEKLHFLDIGNSGQDEYNIGSSQVLDFQTANSQYGEEKLVDWLRKYRQVKGEDI